MQNIGYIPAKKKATFNTINCRVNTILPYYHRTLRVKIKRFKVAPLEQVVSIKFRTYEEYLTIYREIKRLTHVTEEPQYILPIALCKRIRAAVLIQAWWKGVLGRAKQIVLFKSQNRLMKGIDWQRHTLYNTKYAEYVKCLRAAHCIRNFFVWLKVKRRIAALRQIATHVAAIKTKFLAVDITVYHNLQHLITVNRS